MSKQYLVICRPQNSTDEGYRIQYDSFGAAYRKFLHTIWYYISKDKNIPIICSMFEDRRILYNFVGTKHENYLVDCFDGTKSAENLSMEDLSKLILAAVIEYESNIEI